MNRNAEDSVVKQAERIIRSAERRMRIRHYLSDICLRAGESFTIQYGYADTARFFDEHNQNDTTELE